MEDPDDDLEYEALPNSPTHVNMLAGALAGITEHALMYPVDAVKTRMQTGAVAGGVGAALARISSLEGGAALWRGVASVVAGAGPAHALSFGVYEHVKERIAENGGVAGWGPPRAHAAAAGACATIAHDGLMTPFDVIKQRMQIESGSRFSGISACAKHILKTEGPRAFYVSYPTTLAMNIPFHMIHFSAYESFKKALNPNGGYDPFSHCIAGGLAGGLAAAATTPLDVVKTLLQTRGVSEDVDVRRVKGFKSAVRLIQRQGMANGGSRWAGFFRGVGPRVMTHVPATAISWSTYEFLKVYFVGTKNAPAKVSVSASSLPFRTIQCEKGCNCSAPSTPPRPPS
ncbi:mitochondrial carrier domain-containing protein [Chytriomyces sp. MP71]|nr:mitochondrial carrier domain-containing protein [Chytriomyces sp. MP71]